jgi:hypothetical protein
MGWAYDPGYWLSRLVFTRGLAVVYALAFLSARNQFRPLLGSAGLLPVPRFVARVPFRRAPSLFQLRYSDALFEGCCWLGLLLSVAALAGAADLLPLPGWMAWWLVLWALYLSIVNVGQTWYGFGWESLLLETGFLAIFSGPADVAPPIAVLWMLRWVLFRLEFGAGMIKMRGDRCWRELTCLEYHHETQPMPNPLSWYFHNLPRPLHRVEVLANHATQLVLIFGLAVPQPGAGIAAAVVVVTQGYLMLSGNFAWLNFLTLVLATSALDGRWLAAILPIDRPDTLHRPGWFAIVSLVLAAAVLALSYRPARNLLSRRQLMNASFDPLHLVNTYGAFGSVTRTRYEMVIEATLGDPDDPDGWREYEFKGKPGDPTRRPRQWAPYHLRLDWLMWFVGISVGYGERWLVPLVRQLLRADPATLRLLRAAPFAEQPRYVRVRRFRYRFTSPAERRDTRAWWVRSPGGTVVPPVSLADLDRTVRV